MSPYQIAGRPVPVVEYLDINGHKIPILDLKELPDKLRTDSEEEDHDLSG